MVGAGACACVFVGGHDECGDLPGAFFRVLLEGLLEGGEGGGDGVGVVVVGFVIAVEVVAVLILQVAEEGFGRWCGGCWVDGDDC